MWPVEGETFDLKMHFVGNAFVPKLVCGAGNEDAVEVENLVHLYANNGFRYFDLSAKPEIIEAAMRGLELSGEPGYLNISVGIPGDPHANKAGIDATACIGCKECVKVCPNGAIFDPPFVKTSKCVGCGRCAPVCPTDAIMYYSVAKPILEVIPPLVEKYPISSIELHMVGDIEEGKKQWKDLNKCFKGMLSLCIDRSLLGDKDLIELIKWCIKDRKPHTTIIQADGCPMSGDENEGTTLQAIAFAQIVDRAHLPVYLMVSGGTNQYTIKGLRQYGVRYDGIAYGTYGRQLVRNAIRNKEFGPNADIERMVEE